MKCNTTIKNDDPENWAKAINFVPKNGEIIMYNGILQNGIYIKLPQFKIGDGKTTVNNLPFIPMINNQAYVENNILTL